MTRFKYQSYTGSESYIFILCGAADAATAAETANALTERGFRVAYEVYDRKEKRETEMIADNISRAGSNLVFMSEDSCSAMPYRNFINYIVELPSADIYFRINKYVLKHGLDIQLANKEVCDYVSADDVIERLMSGSVVTQDMKATPGDIQALTGKKRKNLAAVWLLLVLAVLGAGTWAAVNYRQAQLAAQNEDYYQSAEYILPRMNSSVETAAYVNVSKFDNESLVYLDGLVIGTLDMSDGGFTDISALSSVDISVADVSGNPGITTLEPLLACPHLQKVIISKNMLGLADIFSGTDIIVEVV